MIVNCSEITIKIQVLYIDDNHNIISRDFPILITLHVNWESESFRITNFNLIEVKNTKGVRSDIDLKFADRVSSNKFKKFLSNIRSHYKKEMDELSDFFKEYSYADEYQKFVDLLNNYSVHKLHDTK
jgi:hypothetical protein